MNRFYLMLYNCDGKPMGFKVIPDAEYHTIAGNLEVVPEGYSTHRIVSRSELMEHFELSDEE